GRTARSSGSTAPCKPSGPTATSSPATKPAATPLHPGYTPTTLNAATAHSAASRPSVECHQPDGRVHLEVLLDVVVVLEPFREPGAYARQLRHQCVVPRRHARALTCRLSLTAHGSPSHPGTRHRPMSTTPVSAISGTADQRRPYGSAPLLW